MADASIGQAVFIILIFTILIIINIVYIHANALKAHWSEYKCAQWAAYLAPMIGEDSTSSFADCVTNVQNANNTLNSTQKQQEKEMQFASLQSANNAHAATAATSASITSSQTASLQQNISNQSIEEIRSMEWSYFHPQQGNVSQLQQEYLQNFFQNILPSIFKAPGGDWLGLEKVYDELKTIDSTWKAFINIL